MPGISAVSKPAPTRRRSEGSVTLDWQVDDDGEALSRGLVRSDFTDKSFHECLAKAVGGWRFPEPQYGEKKYVEHTFQFRDEKKN